MSLAALSLWTILTGAPAPMTLLANASTACAPAPAPPTVEYNFVNTPPQVTHHHDYQSLGQFSVDTTFSQHKNEVFMKAGLMQGMTRVNHSAAFNLLQNPASGDLCLYVDRVTVTISYEPVVHIVRNFKQGSCRFNTTWEHELRHVNTDIITFNEYGGYLKQAAQMTVQGLGPIGPFPEAQLDAQKNMVMNRVGDIMNKAVDEVGKVRMQRQQLIDTREEYLRVSRACPKEPL